MTREFFNVRRPTVREAHAFLPANDADDAPL
jgi:hypothetical protein